MNGELAQYDARVAAAPPAALAVIVDPAIPNVTVGLLENRTVPEVMVDPATAIFGPVWFVVPPPPPAAALMDMSLLYIVTVAFVPLNT